MGLQVDVRLLNESTAVLALQGRLDAVTSRALKTRIDSLAHEGRVNLVCDLAAVGSLDSSGLSALVSGLEIVRRQGGFLKLAGVGPEGARSFKRTGLDRVFELYPDVEAALRES